MTRSAGLRIFLAFCCLTISFVGISPFAMGQERDRKYVSDQDSRYRPPGGVQLGVRVRNLDTGVEITYVFPNSPAARVGLQPGDRIITVGGYQVGYVDNKLFDLGDECNLRVTPNGMVRTLVHIQRTTHLSIFDIPVGAPVPVTPPIGVIPPINPGWGQGIISGTLQLDRPLSVPFGSVMQIQLIQEGLNGLPDVPVADTALRNFQGFPSNYSMVYRSGNLVPGRRYYVDARLMLNNQILCQTTQRNWATGGGNTRLDLMLTPVNTSNSPNQNVAALITTWYRQYLGREADPAGLQAHLQGLQTGQSLIDVRTSLLSSNEFYDRCRNNPQVFMYQLYFMVLDRQPLPRDVDFWLNRLQILKGNRSSLVREFLIQASKE